MKSQQLLRLLFVGLWLVLLFQMQRAGAHDLRSAYLEVNETSPGCYEVLWRTPLLDGMRLPIVLKFPGNVCDIAEPALRVLPDSIIERRWIQVAGSDLAGNRIEFVGLQRTTTDVLVRVQTRGGLYSTALVQPSEPWIEIVPSRGPAAVAGAYVVHGIEHILFGYDHLLFVFALILIVRRGRMLLVTITMFTVAHSITLALATLGVAHVPAPPVEAIIALSILLLACEIVRLQRGHASLTARWPWLVAFAFGLLHGFGFASALIDIGLPRGDVPLALFAFNLGVELGQLAFIALVFCALALARRLKLPAIVCRHALPVATYAIGVLAAFWFFERLAVFVT